SQRNNPLADFPDGLRIAQPAYELWVDMISVERHSCLPHVRNRLPCPFQTPFLFAAELPCAGVNGIRISPHSRRRHAEETTLKRRPGWVPNARLASCFI